MSIQSSPVDEVSEAFAHACELTPRQCEAYLAYVSSVSPATAAEVSELLRYRVETVDGPIGRAAEAAAQAFHAEPERAVGADAGDVGDRSFLEVRGDREALAHASDEPPEQGIVDGYQIGR